MAAGERSPLLLCGHRLFDSAVVPTVPALAVAVAVAAALRQGEFSIALPPGLLTQFVPVVLDVRLLLQSSVVRLQNQPADRETRADNVRCEPRIRCWDF